MTLVKSTTHIVDAKARLVEQFRGSLNLEALIAAYVEQVQDLENVFFQLLLERTLENAVGVQLDNLGTIIGEERMGLSDDDYRLRLRVRVKINASSGTPEQILKIFELLFPDNGFQILEFYPAAFNLIINNELTEDALQLAEILKESRPAGVKAFIEYTLAPDTDTFTFATGDTAEASTTQGFSNDAGTSGGKFADAVEA